MAANLTPLDACVRFQTPSSHLMDPLYCLTIKESMLSSSPKTTIESFDTPLLGTNAAINNPSAPSILHVSDASINSRFTRKRRTHRRSEFVFAG